MRENVKFFTDHNVTAVYVEGQQHPADRQSTAMGELRAYLWGRVLWNPDMTEEEFIAYTNDFMNYYYGDAGPLLLKYVDTVYGDMLDNRKYNKSRRDTPTRSPRTTDSSVFTTPKETARPPIWISWRIYGTRSARLIP